MLTRNKDGSYSDGKWLIYKRGGWWYCYCKRDGEYADYIGMFPTLIKAKDSTEALDKIGYGS